MKYRGRRNAQIVDQRIPGQPSTALGVACTRPSCLAPVGWRCRRLVGATWQSLKHVHDERKRALLTWPDC